MLPIVQDLIYELTYYREENESNISCFRQVFLCEM
jgi:hypothetical protein